MVVRNEIAEHWQKTSNGFEAKCVELQAKVRELEDERATVVDACGFDYDNDPEAPKTLTEYVRETQLLAVRCASEWTGDYREAAVRRLSRNSEHIGKENENLRARVTAFQTDNDALRDIIGQCYRAAGVEGVGTLDETPGLVVALKARVKEFESTMCEIGASFEGYDDDPMDVDLLPRFIKEDLGRLQTKIDEQTTELAARMPYHWMLFSDGLTFSIQGRCVSVPHGQARPNALSKKQFSLSESSQDSKLVIQTFTTAAPKTSYGREPPPETPERDRAMTKGT